MYWFKIYKRYKCSQLASSKNYSFIFCFIVRKINYRNEYNGSHIGICVLLYQITKKIRIICHIFLNKDNLSFQPTLSFVGPESFTNLTYNAIASMYPRAAKIPGMKAAKNILAIFCSVTIEYIISITDGGINMPKVPPAAIVTVAI